MNASSSLPSGDSSSVSDRHSLRTCTHQMPFSSSQTGILEHASRPSSLLQKPFQAFAMNFFPEPTDGSSPHAAVRQPNSKAIALSRNHHFTAAMQIRAVTVTSARCLGRLPLVCSYTSKQGSSLFLL